MSLRKSLPVLLLVLALTAVGLAALGRWPCESRPLWINQGSVGDCAAR